jgi:hypothetical protein
MKTRIGALFDTLLLTIVSLSCVSLMVGVLIGV